VANQGAAILLSGFKKDLTSGEKCELKTDQLSLLIFKLPLALASGQN
jgi:hypothetical protein